MGKTGIQWTDNAWNYFIRCSRESPGCNECYAFTLHDRRYVAWAKGRFPTAPEQYHHPFSTNYRDPVTGERQGIQVIEDRLAAPLHWRTPKRVFVNSMSDVFHPEAPNDAIERMFAVMAVARQHTFQILTKRPQRMEEQVRRIGETQWAVRERVTPVIEGLARTARERLRYATLMSYPWKWPLPNVWLGASVESQEYADLRIPPLLHTPAAVRFLSMEPLLDRVTLALSGVKAGQSLRGLDWIIIGGESGPRARPMELAWVEEIIEQCRALGIAVFVKQLGTAWAKANHAKDRHGGDMSEWPEHLRIREFPVARRIGAAV